MARQSLWQRSTHEDRSSIRAQTARSYQEDDILPGLKLRLHFMKVRLIVDRLLVDFQDDVAAAYAHRVAKPVGLYILHNHALGIRKLHALRNLGSDVLHVESELALLRFGLLAALVFFS